MRRLRTVAIEGFKTFARPIVVDVADGMTAVVGPNGCGKSNFIDAIAWAVGSRSWKTLRGSEMEDVIFHGADTVPPAERAIVRLVFDNSDRALRIDLEEVEVSREISRSSGSRAYIARTEARVKDLQALLAGTGLVGGFSLVRQGMVDRLILSPPEELGRWIEEAANIAAFRTRKREALDRLEKVRANLEEAERRVDALRREHRKLRDRAARARERKDLEEKRDLLARQVAAAERKEIETAIDALNGRRTALPEEDAAIAAQRESLQEKRGLLEEELAAASSPPTPELSGTADSPPITEPEMMEKIGRIKSIAAFVDGLARRLDEAGPQAWPAARSSLDRAVSMIREVQSSHESPIRPAARPNSPTGALAALRATTREIDELDSRRSALARELAGLDQENARLEERLAILGPVSAPDPSGHGLVDLKAARGEVARLTREMERIGPVDETAARREAELAGEIEGGRASVKDLKEAQGKLLGFVEQVDVYAAQVFQNTLVRVGKRFQEYFGMLFGGGQVRLRLVPPEGREGETLPDLRDEANPPGVEILVKLPGKGECALTLLSGGERSLTGIALVLALAAGDQADIGKSGRLIIMDEVDAALDQANAVRFARLVGQLARSHQVLCVTHNSLTTQEAARLIGITSGVATGTSIIVEAELPAAVATPAPQPAEITAPSAR